MCFLINRCLNLLTLWFSLGGCVVFTPILPVLAAILKGVRPLLFSMSSSLSLGFRRAVTTRMRSYMLVMNSVFSLELSATMTRACSTVFPWESFWLASARWYSLSMRKSTTLGWLVQAARDRGSSPSAAKRDFVYYQLFVSHHELSFYLSVVTACV